MGLFSWIKKGGKQPHCFVFVCRGPDPTGMSDVIQHFGMTGQGMYEAMVQLGYKGKKENMHMYGPDWNKTRYSSWKPMPDEITDLMAKVKKTMQEDGFPYAGEDVKTLRFNPATSFGQMGLFMTYLFTER